MPVNHNETTPDYLIRGQDYLAQRPGFKLVGRDEEMKRLIGIMMRGHANNVLLVGPGGVGGSALCLGLEEGKNKDSAPFDLVRKRFLWLDTDGLFSSGDPNTINESFQKTQKTLSRTTDSVLIIDDMKDFIEAARSNSSSNLINALMRSIKHGETQAIFETRDDDLEVVLKAHSDLREHYTMLDVEEPEDGALKEIVETTVKQNSENYHGIKVSCDAINTAIELTTKYRIGNDIGLSRAQPERSITLLDRALTTYRLESHAQDLRIKELKLTAEKAQRKIKAVEFKEVSREELESILTSAENDISAITAEWEKKRNTIKKLFKDVRKGEEMMSEYEEQLHKQHQKEQEAREHAKKRADDGQTNGAINQFLASAKNLDSKEITTIIDRMAECQKLIDESKAQFDALTAEINDSLELRPSHVLAEFSNISGIPVNKLTQDERAKLLSLDTDLDNRVFGQREAVTRLSNQVRVAKAGLQSPNKPQGSFLFLGPSGVGKTEIAKALSEVLLDDENMLLRFDMSEYMEKHAVAKLIGAPPGYDGYEAGGLLTNAMRRNPRRIILFDEIEKAHPDVFNIFLQVLDDARLTDNRGLTVSFRDAIILMTTNIGTPHFLQEENFIIARENALAELDKHYRGEFLNRFNGRQNIVCFNKLELSTIEMIARRDIGKLNKMLQTSMPNLGVAMTDSAVAAMCKDYYKPVNGARGVTGYIESSIKPEIASTVLFDAEAEGTINVDYCEKNRTVKLYSPAQAEDFTQKNHAR